MSRASRAAAILLMLAGCGGPGFRADDPAAAEFRSSAAQVYAELLTVSCPPVSSAPRRAALAAESERVARMERNPASSAAAFHLAVAKSDQRHRRSADERPCSEDGDPAIAAKRFGSARGQVAVNLDRMTQLAPALLAPAGSAAKSGVEDAAGFRARVADLIGFSTPQCQISTEADNDRIMAPVMARIVRFRSGLSARQGLHFDLAETDVRYYQSRVNFECSDPEPIPAETLGRRARDETTRLLAAASAEAAAWERNRR